ncbi:MAG: saccharopine dehydrogenase NADP-binding domain-containing protein [Candidatus Marinimicrobia bacterium]|nr:saccharopine dehydrogenase NADP-binding domain-containing protein [Candidatus Neomarinimicrobiota bacterium]
MSKNVLILGAGLVSQPLVDYLFGKTDFILTVADIREENAKQVIKGNSRGRSETLDVKNSTQLGGLIAASDLVVSLLPYTLHSLVAKHCLSRKRTMVNASYVSDEIRAMDKAAQEAGVLFLCEMGLDPGIDHMSAVQIIHSVQQRGGKVTEFVSVCGGLPAPDANDNPFGYKFSWSPKGVLLAGKNSARYIENSKEKVISSEQLFHSTKPMEIEDFNFESYPNRDSVSYKSIYGLEDIDLLMRGTLRYAGWHEYIIALRALNLLEETPVEDGERSFAEFIGELNDLDPMNIVTEVAAKLGITADHTTMKALQWLGLFDSNPRQFEHSTAIDELVKLMSDKMSYSPGERDMVVLQHRFKAQFEDHTEEITSTLIDYGIPGGNSSMARTVSLPLAIAVKLILEEKIKLTGVQIPVDRIIYEPVLEELKTVGISFKEEIVRYE